MDKLLEDNPYKSVYGGPCVKRLEEILTKLNVQRQAYHGRSFVGNHVNKMLKVSGHTLQHIKQH